VPIGFEVLEPTEFRRVNLKLKDGDVEMALSVLARQPGGRLANLNRWRKQFGLPPTHDDSAKESIPMLGRHVGRVYEVKGAYVARPNTPELAEGWALIGVILEYRSWLIFVKMTGPEADVLASREGLVAFSRSLRAVGFHVPPQVAAQGGHEGHGHGGEMPGGTPGGAGDRPAAGKIKWRVPDGWRQRPELANQYREMTFSPEGSDQTTCWLAVFGVFSSVEGNVSRWCREMGAAQISSADVAKLEQIDMLGERATLIEIDGRYRGAMGGDPIDGARMIGAILGLKDGRSVFVKMVGPKDVVVAQRGAFVEFCGGLSR